MPVLVVVSIAQTFPTVNGSVRRMQAALLRGQLATWATAP